MIMVEGLNVDGSDDDHKDRWIPATTMHQLQLDSLVASRVAAAPYGSPRRSGRDPDLKQFLRCQVSGHPERRAAGAPSPRASPVAPPFFFLERTTSPKGRSHASPVAPPER